MASTKQALMSRGIDTSLAAKLANDGHKLKTLKTKTKPALIALGLTEHQAILILNEKRPPIPPAVLFQILHSNRWCCCVCRDSSKPIVVHHISPWAESRDHTAQNLATVCHDCHDNAHSKKSLSQNLTPKLLATAKQKWEKTVSAFDQRALQKSSEITSDCWYYFNHLRLLRLAAQNGINPKKISNYSNLQLNGYVDKSGQPISQKDDSITLYNHGEGRHVYYYMAEIINEFLGHIDVINVSDFMDLSQIKALARPKDIIFIQGAHIFSGGVNGLKGPGQIRVGYRKVGLVKVEYVFDAWEATSTSAWACWLRGRQSAGSLCQVKSVDFENGLTIIKCTVLAIAFGLDELKIRDYLNYP